MYLDVHAFKYPQIDQCYKNSKCWFCDHLIGRCTSKSFEILFLDTFARSKLYSSVWIFNLEIM